MGMHKGFTLIELMIAVAIVAILGAIAYPAFTSQIQRGRLVECRSGLLQSMQQQERYYTQFNRYVAFTAGATTAPTKAFSGDTLAGSACTISAEACSGADVTTCILLKSIPKQPSSSAGDIAFISLNSNGLKGCRVAGADYSGASPNPSGEKICWP